ncbi:MAG: acetyl-CoA hydrolase/transferase family protein [Acidimicrobiia bacterium]
MAPHRSTDADAFLPAPGPDRAGRAATIEEAMAAIGDGARVYFSPICSVPVSLLDALAAHADRWSRLTLATDYLIDPVALFAAPGAPFHLLSLQPTPATEAMRAAGVMQTVSASYGQFLRYLVPGGTAAVDVALVQVSPPGPDGRFSLGVGGGVTAELIRRAPLVIAEVNPAMPYTFGATECRREEFDLLVEVDHPLVELAVPPGDDVARAIGTNAASQVPDGATLEFGIGAIPEAVLAALAGRRDLGLHGGMISDAVVDLAAGGALTGARKSLDPGLHVGAGVVGTRKVFDWVDRNPDVYVVGSAYSHGIGVLARQERFCAINSAIEIGCDGSVNAEVAGTRVVSGPGGQPDFAIGADLAPGGISLITLRSTAGKGGAISRIVDHLPETSPTTLPRHLVDRVVTEFGVAALRGRSPQERRDALRAIAHPDHRSSL